MIGAVSNVKIISSFKNRSKPYRKIQSRKTHGFIFRLEGSREYTVNGEVFKVNEGEMIFLPKGSCYESVSSGTTYTSINFEADIEDPRIAVYSMKGYAGAHSVFSGFSEIWNFGNEADRYKCMSNFYDLLSYLSRIDHLNRAEQGNYHIIEPALDYLKGHIYDTGFKIEKLHRICGISDTYFRKIFVNRFDITPQEYVLKERITHARLIIENGDYDSIKSVAESVGFSDPLYFSKAFRKYYGFPPSSI